MAAERGRITAERSLFVGLLDDAAVFPPGLASLPDALAGHAALRAGPWADLVGPLLLPAASVPEAAALAAGADTPVHVGLIGRPGVPATDVVDAVERAGGTQLEVVVVEIGADADWPVLRHLGLPLSVEVPRGPDQPAVLDAIASAARSTGSGSPIQAKFRTGATPTWTWPDEGELAAYIREAIDRDLGFKLTGGLHHVVRGRYAESPGAPRTDQHGLLNVVLAVRWALNGAEVDELTDILAERDPDRLVEDVERMSTADVAIVRAFFTSYGCCTVPEPLTELTDVGLLPAEDR